MPLSNLSNEIELALAAAGLNTRTGTAAAALQTIRKAFESARIAQRSADPRPAHDGAAVADADVIDVEATLVEDQPAAAPVQRPQQTPPRGEFLDFVHVGSHGTRAYKLYVPASHGEGRPMPLVVMLHGCKQHPDSFAQSTRLNDVADELGFLVAYPEQPAGANGSNCWNWFEPPHQGRAGAEPSLIVGIVREIERAYRVDERAVFAAGLSAGAAMAVILGEAYPEVFAAVAAHSGLPHGAAHDVASAFAAMHGAMQPAVPARGRTAQARDACRGVPTIVFHGDRDATVVPQNGEAIAHEATSKLAADRGGLNRTVEERQVNGRRCTLIRHTDRHGAPVAEHWTVHGAGHAWFGGSAGGSFSDPQGPDASREMMRFFLGCIGHDANALLDG